MSRKNKIRIFKIILAVAVLVLMIGITIYLFPVMKNLTTLEGQVAFKEKVETSGMIGLLSLFGLQVVQIFLFIIPRRTNRNIGRHVLWWIMGNHIYYGIKCYDINNHIFFS